MTAALFAIDVAIESMRLGDRETTWAAVRVALVHLERELERRRA